MTKRRLLLAAIALAAAVHGAHAETPRIENVVSFSTSANLEVTKDLLSVTLQVVRDGTDAATVQSGLKQVLDAALADAKKSAVPGQMEVRTGNFSLNPRYGRDGKINGWQGQAELVLEGKDLPRVAQTAGRLNGMNVVNVSQSLSRELTEKHDAQVTADAIQKFRVRAAELAKQFGFAGYTLREVNVQSVEQVNPPRPMYRMNAEAAAMSSAPVPVEAGRGTLTSTVSGSVVLTK
jgi:predicted secreted protein